MDERIIHFALLVVLSLLIQGYYAMMEMACVSFNKVRLQYYVTKKSKRALWLSYLIKNPARLFGTTLIGVNAAMQFGSEAARRFYASVGLSPDLAPLSQVILVLLIAELAPMIAARKYAENVTMLGVPFLYFSSKVLSPVIWLFDLLCKGVNRLFRISQPRIAYHLSREELQNAIEEREESSKEKDFDTTLGNIFELREKVAKDLMQPIKKLISIPSTASVNEVREMLLKNYTPCLLIYHNSPTSIIGIIYPRDLIRLSDSSNIKEVSRPPWFITQKNSIFQILKQFRWNNQSLAIVLDERGEARGILTLDAIFEEIFETEEGLPSIDHKLPQKHQVFVERSFPGDTLIEEINRKYRIHLKSDEQETLEELMIHILGHHPTAGESVRLDGFELTAEEASLLEVSTIRLRTRMD